LFDADLFLYLICWFYANGFMVEVLYKAVYIESYICECVHE